MKIVSYLQALVPVYTVTNFNFYLCLRINFHTSSFWVLILAAVGPYWVLISQKNGSLSQSLGVFISFRGSVFDVFHTLYIGIHATVQAVLRS